MKKVYAMTYIVFLQNIALTNSLILEHEVVLI